MAYTPSQEAQFRKFFSEATARVAVYFKTTLGLPEDMFFDEWDSLPDTATRANFLNNVYLKHPKIFEGMDRYNPA